MQNNHQQPQLLSTTSTRYTVGSNNYTSTTTTMAKKTKQHRNNKSPKPTRPPDPQVVEQSPAAHERAIEINQQRIKNKRNNARSITEFTQPSPPSSQLPHEESDLHLDDLAIEDERPGSISNTDGWTYPSNQYENRSANAELKRKEAQMTQEVEDNVNRNLDTNSFAALDSGDYDSSSSHSSASKKQKRVPTPQFNDDQDEVASMNNEEEPATQYKDGSYEQIVYNNPNTDLTPDEIIQLIEAERHERKVMAMGAEYVRKLRHEEFQSSNDVPSEEDDRNSPTEAEDDCMEDNEAEAQQDEDRRLFNNIAKAKLSAAKQQHRHLQTEKETYTPPRTNHLSNNPTYAAATSNTTPPTIPVQNPYIISPRDIALRNRHLGQAIDARCYKNFYTRFQLTFREPPPGLNDVEKFYISIFTKFISILKDKGCKQAVILPFKEVNRGTGAISTKKITIDPRLSKLNIFFDGVSKQSWKAKDDNSPSDKYINVLIGHQETADNILVDTRSKFMETGIKFYAKNSQAEEVYVCGWLLYSAYHMNAEEIERKL